LVGGGKLPCCRQPFPEIAMSTSSPLFQATSPGSLSLKNRIALAPMTRSRAIGNIPNELMREYYRQRSGAGLLITEGTAPAPEGLGYARIPGLFNQAQADAWREIASTAHANGARLVVQLMHTGRVGHPLNLPEGSQMIGPSAVAAAGQMWTDSAGMQDQPAPKAMDAQDLARVRESFANAARLAVAAGADGVELHAANGYLLAQFLNPRSNVRSDQYGGSAENRRRFVLEVVEAVSAAIGADRVGLRLSPFNPFNDLAANYEGEEADTLALVAELAARKIGYLHLIATPGAVSDSVVDAVRAAFPGTLVLAGDYNRERAVAALSTGRADVIAFGRPFIGNPDLPERLQLDRPLSDFDANTLYTPGASGYSDYLTHEEKAAVAA
jgi:N-ethylmaleimide reductase